MELMVDGMEPDSPMLAEKFIICTSVSRPNSSGSEPYKLLLSGKSGTRECGAFHELLFFVET